MAAPGRKVEAGGVLLLSRVGTSAAVATPAAILAAWLALVGTLVAPGIARARPEVPLDPTAYVRTAEALLTGAQAVLWLPGPEGTDRLAVGLSDRLEVGYLDARTRWVTLFSLSVPAGVTALAAADLDGAGELELVAATGGAGSLVRIRSVLRQPVPVPASGFLFGAASRVLVAELDGRPPAELLAANVNGELFVYSASAGGGYRRVWRSPSGTRVTAFAAADFDGDGTSEVALAEPDRPVTVYRWRAGHLEPIASVYPWGSVTALASAGGPATPPLLAVVTDRSLVYVYRWEAQRLTAPQVAFDPTRRLRLDLNWAAATVAVRAGPDGTAAPALVLEGAGSEGIEVVKVEGDRLELLARVAWPGASPGFARLSDGRLVVVTARGTLDVLSPVAADYLALRLDGTAVTLPQGTRLWWEGDRPLIDVQHLSRVVPVLVSLDREARQAWIAAASARVRVAADVAVADGDRIVSTPLPVPPHFDAATGRLYVPFEALRPLGWQVAYDPTVRRLVLHSPWPGGQT